MTKAEAFKKWYAERTGHPAHVRQAHEALLELEQQLNDLIFDAEQVLLHGYKNDAGNWTPKAAVIENLELNLKRLQKAD
jgi:hypothetical protein